MNIDGMPINDGFGHATARDGLLNCDNKGPRFSFVMIVLNGMPFIEYSLKSVYDFAHEIIIVEGAVEKCMFVANADGGSTDGTVEFMESFPDPQNKVKLIQGRWPEKCEMQNEALKHVTGDHVWLIDSDEVYKRESIEKIKEILRSDPSITQVNFIPESFWKGLDYIFVSSKFFEDSCHYRRLFKYVPGSTFTTHRPPTMVWPGSNRTTEQINLLDGTATRAMGITFNHYSYVLDDQVKQKIQLYDRYGWGRQWNLDLRRWYEECFLKWTPENRDQIDSQYPIWTGDINSRTQIFNGTHPEVMKYFGKEQGRKEYWPEGYSLSVIGKTDYQKKVLDAWRYIKIDAPLQSRRRVMTENMEQGRSFWNIHVALAFLADRLRPQNYLEVGVRTGGSLIPLVHNCDVKEVVAVDMWLGSYSGLHNSMEYTAGQINRYKTAAGKRFEIELIKGDSHSVLKDLIASGRRFSLITVDGDHSEAGAWEDLQDAVELLGDEGAIVFDDIIHPDHLFLNGLVDRLVGKYPFFQVLINSEQDNGCAVFLKKIDPVELLQERGVEASHSKTDCNEHAVGGELPIATDFNSRTQIFTGTPPEVMKDFAESYSFSETGRQQTTLPAPDEGIIQAESAITDPMERLRRRPQYLKIETTNICNADCAFCAYRFMQRKKGAMSMDLFRKVIDDYVAIGGGALTMSPLVGDCLVDAKFVERLRHCRNFNEITHIGFHTNHIALSRWTDEQVLEILDLIDVWNCSVGPNRDVYRDMFGVDKFEEVVANLERLHKLISVSEHKPRVQLNGRAAAGPFEEDERLKRLSSDLAGRKIHWNTSYCDWGGFLGDLPRNTPVERAGGLGEKRLPCVKALISAIVFCDGRVGFCGCADFDALLTIGDANREKLGDILAGRERLKLLESFGKPWLNEYCRKCSFYEPMNIEWISKWTEGTGPYHPEPVRPSLERGRRKHLVGQFAEKLEPSAYQPDNVTAFSNVPPATAKAKSVLWIRTDSIGDNVLASSMLPHIRQKYEGAKITVVCQEHIAELYEVCPCVDDIVVFDRKRALLNDHYREEIVMRLRALEPDVSLNSIYSREPLTDWFAIKCGAEQRIAFNGSLCNISAELRDMHNQFYTDLLPSPGPHKLELERSKDFLRGLGIEAPDLQPMIWTTAEDETFAEKFFQDNGLSAGNTIALFPSAQHSEKVYEQYKSVLQHFDGFRFVILGGKDAEGYAGEICSPLPQRFLNLAGRTTIRQMAAIIRRCCLYLGSDSAGAHIACAVGVPSVVILGGGHFGRFIPYSPLTSVACLPLDCYGCNWNCRYESPYCVKDVAPAVVIEAIWRTLEKPSQKTRVFVQGDSLCKAQADQSARKTLEQFLEADNVDVIPVEARASASPMENTTIEVARQAPECDVSIVLCTKDRAELLDRMLSSLEQAACGVVYELIVIEGSSSDNTLDVLQRHNMWHVYNESQHLGPGRHSWPELYNFGFSKARGKWAMYASDDIVFAPNSIARAVEMLDRQKEEVAGGVFFYKNLRPTRQEWVEYGIDFTHGNKLLLNYGLVRLDRFRECGGLEECYNFYCADTDLCYKLYERGHELIPLGGCFVTHDNLLDVQKQANADASGRDIELCQRRWRHFVPADIPSPRRLLWRDELAEALDVPGELERIDSGIESFWRGLAYFGQGMFAEAERQFMQAVQSQCDHRQVLWYLALAADKCQDNAIVEKAATGVVRLAPDFEPALELLLQVTGTEQYSPERALCSARSDSVRAVHSYAGGGGPAEFHLDGQGWGGAEPADRAAPIATIRKMPRRSGPDHSEMELRTEIGRFNKVVVWGLKTSEHTHAHIHRHFFDALEKIGARAVFVDDSSRNADTVESNDLVIAVDVAISHLPVADGVYYCLHNCPDHIHRRLTPARNIRLQTYMSSAEPASGGTEKWDEVTFFDSATRTLYQPWATDLLAREFKEPILNRSSGVVFWVGSVWDDDLGRGNINEIQTLKDALEARGIRFIHLRGISDSLNVRYVRNSLIAPAIVGRWQMQNDYLPCRMWKNISYGQLGVSNVKKFDDVFDDCTVKGRSIEELIDNTLSVPFSTYRDMICRQQEIVKSRHTYVNRLLNIMRAFDSVENH